MSSQPNESIWTAVAPNLCSRSLWEIAYPSDGINSEFIGLNEFELINKHATSSEVLCCAKRYLDHAFRHRVAAGAVIGVSAPTQAAKRGTKQDEPTAILFSTGLQVSSGGSDVLCLLCKSTFPAAPQPWELSGVGTWEQIQSKSAGLPPLGSASRALGRTSAGMSHSAEFLRALPPQSVSMLKQNLMQELEAAATAPARQLLELAGGSIADARMWVEAALHQALASQSTPSGDPALNGFQNGAISVWRSHKEPTGGAVAQVLRSTASASLAAGRAAEDISMPFVAVLETIPDKGKEKGNRHTGGGSSSSSSSSAAGHRSRLEARLLHWTDALPALLARRHVLAQGASHEGAATAAGTGPASSASSSAAVAPPGLPPAVASGTGPGAAHSGGPAPSSASASASAAPAPAEAGASSGKPSASMLWRSIAASKRGPPVAVQQPGPARPATRAGAGVIGAGAGAGAGAGKGKGSKKDGKVPRMSVREAQAVASRAPRLLCRVTKWHMKGHHGRMVPVEPSALLKDVQQDDLYCHYEQVSYASEYNTVLQPGQEVECGIGPDPQRLATFVATRVTLPGGGHVTGYPRGRFDMLYDPAEKRYVTQDDLDNPCFLRPPGGGGGGAGGSGSGSGRGGKGKGRGNGKGRGSHENGGRSGAGQQRERGGGGGGGNGRTDSVPSPATSSRPSGGAAKGPKLAADPSSAGAAVGTATRAGTGSSGGVTNLGGGADGRAPPGPGPASRAGWSGWAAQKRDGSAQAKSGGKG